jgi:hypothetical protein
VTQPICGATLMTCRVICVPRARRGQRRRAVTRSMAARRNAYLSHSTWSTEWSALSPFAMASGIATRSAVVTALIAPSADRGVMSETRYSHRACPAELTVFR